MKTYLVNSYVKERARIVEMNELTKTRKKKNISPNYRYSASCKRFPIPSNKSHELRKT